MGDLLADDKIANRSFLISPQGDGRRPLRQDPHVRRRLAERGELSRSRKNYQAGDTAVLAELPWGTLGLTVCYDLRFPQLYRALARPGADSSPSLGLYPADRQGALARADAGARDRERLLCLRRGPGRQARERPGNLSATASSLRPGARSLPRPTAFIPSVIVADINMSRGAAGTPAHPLAPARSARSR